MLKVGIVGLPNVGKSTLFNAILKREQALSANYPFATIDPNTGVVEVIDKRLDKLAELIEKEKGVKPPIIYPVIELVDIAGLVEGANKGEGLGNKFLANIREVDMILQVVRDFEDANIIREHSKNPDEDTDIINTELILKDIESIEKKVKEIGANQKRIKEKEVYEKYLDLLAQGKYALEYNPFKSDNSPIKKEDYLEFIKPLFLLTDKPLVYVFNVDDPAKDEYKNKTEYKGKPVIYINAKLESELSSLDEQDQKEYLKELGINEPGLDKIIKTSYSLLDLITFFTAGEKEVRGWEIKKGTKAPQAAGKIHSDFETNFIKAEVIAYEDFIKYQSRLNAKNHGKLRLEGKEYVVKDADVIEFKIGAS